ncbi:hypothetical protein A6V37_38510 [Paraburkholderia ginsengiterrae]|uniref:Uncharacterized protein n=1 Tax=Paraburkholderia ginsengiterrae TaxID=1462993 RepID=A0A1A9N5W7_9BURK|nr:hypothetical protein A6V37_38510 [Paraburkholderia ginsengiterrae]
MARNAAWREMSTSVGSGGGEGDGGGASAVCAHCEGRGDGGSELGKVDGIRVGEGGVERKEVAVGGVVQDGGLGFQRREHEEGSVWVGCDEKDCEGGVTQGRGGKAG